MRRGDSPFNHMIASGRKYLQYSRLPASILAASAVTLKTHLWDLRKTVYAVLATNVVTSLIVCLLDRAYGPQKLDDVHAKITQSLQRFSSDQKCSFLCELSGSGIQRGDINAILRQHGVTSTCEDQRGDNAYQRVVRSNEKQAIEFLAKICKEGLDQATGRSRLPPLLLAAAAGRLDRMKELEKAGANLSIKSTHEGWNAMDFALLRHDEQMADFLKSRGLKPTKRLDLLFLPDKDRRETLSKYVDHPSFFHWEGERLEALKSYFPITKSD